MPRRIYGLVFVAFVAGLLLVVFFRYRWHEEQRVLKEAKSAMRRGRAADALQQAKSLLAHDPANVEAIRLVAMANRELSNPEEAARYFLMLPAGEAAAHETLLSAADRAFTCRQLLRAQTLLGQVLTLQAEDARALRAMAAVLNASGQRWEAAPYLLASLKQRQFSIEELLLLGNPDEPWLDSDLSAFPTASNDDPLVRLGLASQNLTNGRLDVAIAALRSIIADKPELIAAHSMLGHALLDHGDLSAMPSWHQALPAEADRNSGIWFVRGLWAQSTDQSEAAVRCYWEAISLAPEKRRAHFRLGQLLTALGQADDAEPLLERARQLTELYDLMRPVYHEGASPALMREIAGRLENLGRLWEAWGWTLAVTRFAPDDIDAAKSAVRLREQLVVDTTPQTVTSFSLAGTLDVSDLPLPEWKNITSNPSSAIPSSASPTFKDIAGSAGIHFRYFNSDDPSTDGRRMFETTGGGVSALDYDGDSWPDLYFTQGCTWPPSEQQTEHQDQLYRNMANGRFMECSVLAGTVETRFSQGVAAGDFDNDGFTDIYVANIGQNRLFRNNGDGTFEDITGDAGITGRHWTTSCVLADMDGDLFPDLFDANYLTGQDAFELICGTEYRRTCSPSTFPPAFQQYLKNQGNGLFEAASLEVDGAPLRGKGLGVVAASLSDSKTLDLFIANDGVANTYLRSVAEDSGRVSTEESAVRMGLAFDRDGRAQACMGIAADDANGDGMLDFFVTNYFEESNTLYLQQPGGIFIDGTREAGLRDPSLLFLGFGTQFLDGDLDGFPDLIVANGHVDDFSYDGKLFRMRPQYFRNGGGGRFEELHLIGDDSYFAGIYLGRGLARLDWNRDGREDFAVSHLDSPAALVSSESVGTGNCLSVRLVGVNCSRDAIGTVVTVETGSIRRTRQLTAGDGYQASNERNLIFGLGTAAGAERVTIRWRSGPQQAIDNLSAGYEYLIVEGRPPIRFPLNGQKNFPLADLETEERVNAISGTGDVP